MDEKKKLWIMIGIISALIIFTIGIYFVGNLKVKKLLKDMEEQINQEETQIFYFSRPTCHYCTLLKPITDTLGEEYQLTYYSINTDQYSPNQLQKILKKFGLDSKTFGTPYIVITKNGKVIGQLSGYADENVVFALFQKHLLIPSDAHLAFEYLDYNTFQTIWNSGERSLIMIGETGEKSVQARNILKPLIGAHNLNILYMDIAETGSNENYSTFLSTIGYTVEPTYPVLMIVENGMIVSQTNQMTKEEYEMFLKTNQYIK